MANRNNKKRRQNTKIVETAAPTPPTNSTVSMDDIEQIFMGKGSEDLTDEVIEELTARGWEKEGLLKFQEEGFRYNRARDTLVEGQSHIF
ncbi:MAG: hypothetical protein RBT34_14650 [Anaerolineaceae bacterium]|jgi:hypothetical protein|nr:hypothetical protein [Anaerolineaceae bacterium]